MRTIGHTARVSVLLACAGCLSGVASAQFEGYKVVRVSPASARDVLTASTVAEGLWSERAGPGPFEVYVAPAGLEALTATGVPFEVLIDDLQALLDEERRANNAAKAARDSSFFDSYHNYTDLIGYYQQLVTDFPALASIEVIGQSLEGRPMYAATITGPGDASGRPMVYFNAGQHAREWASPSTLAFIVDELLRNYGTDARVTEILDHVVLRAVPVVNPDGYEYTQIPANRLWRKNRRNNGDGTFGVDLNRNWAAFWGGDGSSGATNSDTYRGTAPFSEPETTVVRDDFLAHPSSVAHIDWHTYSQLILYPWGYADVPAPEPDRTFFELFSREMADIIFSVHGVAYTPQQAIDLYAAAGTASDWSYSVGRKGWTFELRPSSGGAGGFVLPPEQIRPTGQENYAAALRLLEVFIDGLYLGLPDGAPSEIVNGAGRDFTVRIIGSSATLEPGSAQLVFRTDFGTDDVIVPLSPLTDVTFEAALPDLRAGRTLTYHIEARTTAGNTVRYPAAGELAASYFDQSVISLDTCEVNSGWTVGAAGDNATTGLWGLADPEPTAAQPADDHTPAPGINCWITDSRAGTQVGSFDVDGGVTTLTSPSLSALSAETWYSGGPTIAYHRWYSNNAGSAPNADSMPVLLSNDNGSTWTQIEDVSDNTNAWTPRAFTISDFMTPTNAMRLRFVARDLASGSIVEAGVDDVSISIRGVQYHPADLSEDTFVDATDFFAYLDLFVADDPAADLDGDGDRDASDFFLYLDLFVTP